MNNNTLVNFSSTSQESLTEITGKQFSGFVIRSWYWIGPTLFQVLLRPIVLLIMKVLVQLEVKGEENFKLLKGSNCILASNHIHELDGFLLPASISLNAHWKPFYPVAREKEFYKEKGIRSFFYGGKFFRFMGAFPAWGKLHNYEASLINHIYLLDHGESILIFPEGKVTQGIDPANAKGGVAYLLYRTKKPILPVYLEKIKRASIGHRYRVTIGKPLYFEDLFDNEVVDNAEFKEKAYNIMSVIRDIR